MEQILQYMKNCFQKNWELQTACFSDTFQNGGPVEAKNRRMTLLCRHSSHEIRKPLKVSNL